MYNFKIVLNSSCVSSPDYTGNLLKLGTVFTLQNAQDIWISFVFNKLKHSFACLLYSECEKIDSNVSSNVLCKVNSGVFSFDGLPVHSTTYWPSLYINQLSRLLDNNDEETNSLLFNFICHHHYQKCMALNSSNSWTD